MNIKNKKAWQEVKDNNQDDKGGEVVRYAEAWADLMEERMANGEKLEDIAKDTSHEADTNGITGFMYGCAVSTLSQTWKHGKKLGRWSNNDLAPGQMNWLKTWWFSLRGIIFNPALWSFKVKK